MKRSNPLITCTVLSLMSMFMRYTNAKSYQEIHHLLTNDEREAIFGHPFVENVPEYDITHPVQVDVSGRFLSRDLANGNVRRKRDVGRSLKESVFFKMSAFGHEYQLNVTLNDVLFSPHFEMEVRGNGSSEFHHDIEHCHYLGQLFRTEGKRSKVAVSNCDGLQGMIQTPQELFMIHPLPDRLGLEKNRTRAHVIHRRSVTPLQALRKAMREENRPDEWCGVEGKSKRQYSGDSHGRQTNFRRSSDLTRQRTIESLIVVEKVMTKFYGVEQIKTYVPTIINVAHGLLADASIGANIDYIIQKLLILENDAGLELSTHASTSLTNFCRWTMEQNIADDKNPAHFDHAALISKYDFCRSKGSVEGEGCDDVLGLAGLTGMCKQDTSCTLNKDTGLGTAFTLAHETAHNLGAEHDSEGNQCKDGVNIMAARASGKITAFEWSACSRNYISNFLETTQAKCLDDEAKHAVKIPSQKPGIIYNGDQQCERMFGGGSRVCDIPDVKRNMCVRLYCLKLDGYCSTNNEPAADGTECGDNMWCSYGKCVIKGTKGDQDVDGNWGAWGEWSKCYPSCGGGLSERVRECNNPAPRRGGSLCEGKGKDYRYCNEKCTPYSPNPRNEQCKSNRHIQFQGGKTYDWIYDPRFAQDSPKCVLKCAVTEGFRTTTTTFGNVRDGTPCSDTPNSGVCINGQCKTIGCDGSVDSRARLDRCGVCNGDGSSCSSVGGQGNKPNPGQETGTESKTTPPLTPSSTPSSTPSPTPRPTKPTTTPSTQPPAPSGRLVKFTYNKVPAYVSFDSYHIIANIPTGARNIIISEARASYNNLVLEDDYWNTVIDYDAYFNTNYGPKEFRAAGTSFSFTRRNNRERITSPGPTNKRLILLYEVESAYMWRRYRVNYQYIEPFGASFRDSDFPEPLHKVDEVDKELPNAEKRRQSERKTKTKWLTSSDQCSVSCGGGMEVLTAVCVRVDDESPVGDQFCMEKRPEDQQRKCNMQSCPPRWSIGPWTECSKSCNDGTHGARSRQVFCVEDSEGTEVEISESHCKKPKPTTHERCGRQSCPAEWYTVRAGPCSTSCGLGVQSMEVKCVKIHPSGKGETVDEKECTDIKPPSYETCNVDNPCREEVKE
ncbi:A disintegrin and metalloproteinase with thrombospondin motifs 6-like [Acropora muricata]|uniref:A disintegrin and metalloproteinase with thrombospondin motifs 6-like n=1 Tax=Acropora muricata TaxID=159855 RepID=UPI0034E50A41